MKVSQQTNKEENNLIQPEKKKEFFFWSETLPKKYPTKYAHNTIIMVQEATVTCHSNPSKRRDQAR